MKKKEQSIEDLSAELYCHVSNIVDKKTEGLNSNDAKAVAFGLGVTAGVTYTLQSVLSMIEQGYTIEQIEDMLKQDLEESSKV